MIRFVSCSFCGKKDEQDGNEVWIIQGFILRNFPGDESETFYENVWLTSSVVTKNVERLLHHLSWFMQISVNLLLQRQE